MTAHGSRFRSTQSTWNKYERNKFSTDDSGKIEIQIHTIRIYHTRYHTRTFFNSVGERVQNEENDLPSMEFLIPISFSSQLRNLGLKNVRSD